MLTEVSESARAALAVMRQAEREERAASVRRFTALCDYADACSASLRGDGSDLVPFGHEGTPLVQQYAELELAAARGMDSEQAAFQLGYALDVRHRLPRAWAALHALQLRVWQAEKLACLTAELSLDAARSVDLQLSPGYGHWSWRRLEDAARGLVLAALPPAEAERRQREAREQRRVTFEEPFDGVQTLSAALDAVDGHCLQQQIGRLAHVLLAGGSGESLDVRRAQALGLLANPARALQLLQQSVLDAREAGECLRKGQPTVHDSRTGQQPATAPCPLDGLSGHTCGTITVDPEALRPRVELVVHVSEESLATGHGVARSARLGPLTVTALRNALAGCEVRIRPVLRVDSLAPADAYEVPATMREAVLHRNPSSVFPFSSKRRGLDLDHTVPYVAGVPEQTRTDNLGPLSRREHRAKTHGGWRVTQPLRGVFLWRSPLGAIYAVTQSGSYELHALDSDASPGAASRRPAEGVPLAA